MKAILKENGNETILREGTLEEVKGYLNSELDSLLDWLDDAENNWNDFETLKKEIKENIENAEDVEDLEAAFEGINNEMSWWGIFFEVESEMKKEVEKIINELRNGEREFIDLSDDSLFIDNELELRNKLDIDEFGEFLELLEQELENDEEIKKITDKKTSVEFYQGQYVTFTESGYTLVYMMPVTYEKYNGDVETFLNSF